MLSILIALAIAPTSASASLDPILTRIEAEGYRLHLHPRQPGTPIHVFACTRSVPCQRPVIAERDLPQPYHFDDRPQADIRWQRIDPTDSRDP